jgi:serine/threonine-protein phosphatase 5
VNDKIKYLKGLKREKQFLECIQYEDEMEKINENDLNVEGSYNGPVLEENTAIDMKWIENTLAFLRDQKKIHKKYLWILIKRCKQILDKEANIVNVDVNGSSVREITVCGDIHGQFYDFLNIFKLNGYPSVDRPYLFNGDFVDRGSFSVECMIGLMIFKVWNPACMYLNRGNHENPDLNKMYGFEGEVLAKYCQSTFVLFKNLFYHLPLAHVINKKVLVLHGGLFEKDGVKLDDILKIQRRSPIPSTGLMCDMLWADPTYMNGRHKSKRGVSIEFGPDITMKFLEENDLSNLIRLVGQITSG